MAGETKKLLGVLAAKGGALLDAYQRMRDAMAAFDEVWSKIKLPKMPLPDDMKLARRQLEPTKKEYFAALGVIDKAEQEALKAIDDVEKHLQERKNAEKVKAVRAHLNAIRDEMAKNKQRTKEAKDTFAAGDKWITLFC